MKLIQLFAGAILSILSLISQAQTTSIVYYHNDLLGSPIAATNEQGQVVWRENYRPYGERTKHETAAQKERIFFTARHQDPETGLVYMGARYYDPTIGRFLSTDPVRFQEENIHSFNRYAYSNNNPTRFIDPNGMWAEDAFLAAPGLAVGAYSFGQNLRSGSFLSAAVDFGGMALDGIALAVPGVPGGAGLAIAATRKSAGTASAHIHHICTNKNCVSNLTGGPWTPRFEAIFQKAGMKLEDGLNKITLPGHQGPHPEAYHQAVFDRLTSSTNGLSGQPYRDALQTELRTIGREIQTPGSVLNQLVTKS